MNGMLKEKIEKSDAIQNPSAFHAYVYTAYQSAYRRNLSGAGIFSYIKIPSQPEFQLQSNSGGWTN
jgi:hypothetical protein